MAKSSRASTRKANNQRLAANVFGPVEDARAERLSARLLEIAKQSKPPKPELPMDAQDDTEEKAEEKAQDETSMEVDAVKPSKARIGSKRIDKRKHTKSSSMVFRKYGDRQVAKRKKSAK
ncbi:hypothetical protein B0T10DRAFT_482547 [Thelonectria olida]|uniref:DUF2423 domain-containing protein n=1 Tax=Thelonectria olida TaxID=1576542 RepID=A0A9P9AV56_9HYPO|nr:hypothetical protein B0T10DRAFT_482547 [Thelonectria olida]